jgi:hypothetical protein
MNRNYCFRSLEGQSNTEYAYTILIFKKAALEQAAIKVRQKSQNVSLLPNDWQHTLSHRTRIGAGITFPNFFQKYRGKKQTCQLKKHTGKRQPI